MAKNPFSKPKVGLNKAKVRSWLEEHNMSQAQMAKTLRLSKSCLNRYLTGSRANVPLEKVVKIAKIMGVTLDELREDK